LYNDGINRTVRQGSKVESGGPSGGVYRTSDI